MREAGRSARRVARQLGRSDCVVRRCWDQWIQVMPFTQRPGSGHPRQTIRREDRHICAALDAHPLTPPFGVVPCTRKLDSNGIENQVVFSDARANPDSISAVMTVEFVCGDPLVNA
ncbi:HTH_Tnp_Tc3_2 domain-containing protein [Trichonephila clavipes]|uniref:HTH_Tnp_Tc3_2 domain-containing protein n=1 Tax=Trichonephila clavipes TaxID=2585209 RepID=A0A8X6SXJ7_TRICX|nr:HTH_Tnp_Tc3_2 domain-containing protein [Trichonephila clavipes]